MPNQSISRTDAEAIIQEQVIPTVLQDAPKQSVVMQLGRKLPNMTSNQTRIRVLDLLPMAYWVHGDTGFKRTSKQAWDNVFIDAEELAVIVPISEAVLEDADFDIFGEVTPKVIEAISAAVDAAILFGVNKPANWPADIVTRARQAGNNVAVGSNPNYYDLIMGENGVIAKVEDSGRMVTGVLSAMGMRAKLRGIKDDAGHPIYVSDMKGATPYALDGSPMFFPQNGSFATSIAQLVAGDFSQMVYSIRKDITVKILDQGVIQDPDTKEIVYNLAQQDMIALRVVFRMGWALPNPATRMDGDRVTVPFAYLEPASAMTDYSLTFTVTDSNSAAVADAIVEIDGARVKTNSSGVAVFHLRNGSYKYKVKKGSVSVTGTKAISSSNATQAVTLA
ncbi:MAG: phage major capsid protein [Oscillospiraceae bacterium]|nr:phage major capsid protein [Oscillospiraceae bacterium]